MDLKLANRKIDLGEVTNPPVPIFGNEHHTPIGECGNWEFKFRCLQHLT